VPLYLSFIVHVTFALGLELLLYGIEKDRALCFVNKTLSDSLIKSIETVLCEVSDCILIVN
jgi:hypothetical protein